MVIDDVCCGTVTPSTSATIGVTTKWRHRKVRICLFGCFGHSGLLFEGLDFSDYRTNASELDMAHLHMMLSSGGTGARLVLKLPSLCPSL